MTSRRKPISDLQPLVKPLDGSEPTTPKEEPADEKQAVEDPKPKAKRAVKKNPHLLVNWISDEELPE